MKIVWSENAEIELDEIYEYISLDSESRALQMIERIRDRNKQIAQFPYSGKMVPEYEQNEIREIIESPYRIIYRIKENQIEILSVFHCSLGKPPANRLLEE